MNFNIDFLTLLKQQTKPTFSQTFRFAKFCIQKINQFPQAFHFVEYWDRFIQATGKCSASNSRVNTGSPRTDMTRNDCTSSTAVSFYRWSRLCALNSYLFGKLAQIDRETVDRLHPIRLVNVKHWLCVGWLQQAVKCKSYAFEKKIFKILSGSGMHRVTPLFLLYFITLKPGLVVNTCS